MMSDPLSRLYCGSAALAWLAATIHPALAALPSAAQEVADQGAGDAPANPPPPAAFLFELPDEVKTIVMGGLAVAIAVYLWRNLSKGD